MSHVPTQHPLFWPLHDEPCMAGAPHKLSFWAQIQFPFLGKNNIFTPVINFIAIRAVFAGVITCITRVTTFVNNLQSGNTDVFRSNSVLRVPAPDSDWEKQGFHTCDQNVCDPTSFGGCYHLYLACYHLCEQFPEW